MLMNQSFRGPNIYGPTPFSSHIGTLLFKPRFPFREPDIATAANQAKAKDTKDNSKSTSTTKSTAPPPSPTKSAPTTKVDAPPPSPTKSAPPTKLNAPPPSPSKSTPSAATKPAPVKTTANGLATKSPVSPTSKSATLNSPSKTITGSAAKSAPLSPPKASMVSPSKVSTVSPVKASIPASTKPNPSASGKLGPPVANPIKSSLKPSTVTSTVQNGISSKLSSKSPSATGADKKTLPQIQLPPKVEEKKKVPEIPKNEKITQNGTASNHGGIESHLYYNGHQDHNHNEPSANLFSIQKDSQNSSIAHRQDAPEAQTSINARNSLSPTQKMPPNSDIQQNTLKYTPTRIMVQEIDEGQPCLACKGICPGFRSHGWRKICKHCKCLRESHDIYQRGSNNVLDRIGLKAQTGTTAMHMSKDGNLGSGYSWVPAGLQLQKIEEYMSQLPNHKVPRLHTPGEKYRNKQLVVQLPRQDLAAAYCKHLSTVAEQRAFEDFVNTRNEMALDIGYVNAVLEKSVECRKCKGVLECNELAVMAPKFGINVCWHPACFVCNSCDELLVDLTYCIRDGKIFCERHYAELQKPRCAACDELIFAGEYTKAMNQDWHSGHFCCWQCDQTLTGQRYILRDDHPYCIKCYEEVFANSCDECAKPIGIDSKDLSYKEKHWHENCFLCSMCKISLVDKPFGSKNDRIFCASCYDQAFATRCDGCGEIFKAGMKKMEYKGKQWHDKCFCCALCKGPIGTKSFIPKNEEVYCATCYEEKFATRCTKCKKVISSGGVTYKNEPWHKECFCCCNCGTSLAGQRFTSKDEKPYCANCFGELFAKRCTACTQPITGIGGSKFISFEDRHWHNDCFVCAQCQTSLVGKGFITDSADVLCPECAKARLMAQHA